MEIAAWILGSVFILFGFVVFFGPPYVPTMRLQIEAALDLLDLQPGQVLLELGSGDGTVVRMAAERGIQVVGIELNPILVLVARARCWKYRKQVKIVWGNVWTTTWPQADGIFTFLLGRQMDRLDTHIQAWHTRPVRLASFAFKIPDKHITQEQHGVFLYTYR